MLLFILVCWILCNVIIVIDTVQGLGTDETYYNLFVNSECYGTVLIFQIGILIVLFPGLSLSGFIIDKWEKHNNANEVEVSEE